MICGIGRHIGQLKRKNYRFMRIDRPTPTGTKRDILRLLARQPLGAKSIAHKLQLAEPHIHQHLASLEGYGYVQRLSDVAASLESSAVYTIGSAARGTVPKRYDLMLGALLEAVSSRNGADELSRVLRRAAARLAQAPRLGPKELPMDWRCEKALSWIEKSLAWRANVTAEIDGYRLIAIHSCLLHEAAELPREACANFFAELLGSFCGTHVQQAPLNGSTACCKLKMFGNAPGMKGGEGE